MPAAPRKNLNYKAFIVNLLLPDVHAVDSQNDEWPCQYSNCEEKKLSVNYNPSLVKLLPPLPAPNLLSHRAAQIGLPS